jgi:anti-sigma regulatory factor (Ser/Thr protein kinase)
MIASPTLSFAELTIRADSESASRASAWLQSEAASRGVPRDEITRLDHCLDEALANVIAHGGASARAAPIVLQFRTHRGDDACNAEVTVTDSGGEFDPDAVPAKPRPATLADAEPGGLGLLMIRSFSDSLRYDRRDGRNHLTFGVRWNGAM